MIAKIEWKVAEAPTGKYRSFQRRGWPTGTINGCAAVSLYADNDYSKQAAEGGSVITVCVADWTVGQTAEGKAKYGAFTWRTLKARAATLKEAKDLAVRFHAAHPEYTSK
jgi:hypothetical protein